MIYLKSYHFPKDESGLQRSSKFNTTELFSDYVGMTYMEMNFLGKEESRDMYAVSKIITSDDVFNHILDVRGRNEGKDFRRDVIREQRWEYMQNPMSRPREVQRLEFCGLLAQIKLNLYFCKNST